MNAIMDEAHGENWQLWNGDSAEVLRELPDDSIDLSISSIPFGSTYTYSPSDRDLGNVGSDAEFWRHMSFITREWLRVTKPGRLCAVHVADLPLYANGGGNGESGRKDFSGDTIRHFIEHGWVYHSRITIQKNPQAQAIRTHSKGLLFVQMRRDRAGLWQAWGDYVVVFRKPGVNDVPVLGGFTEEEWIDYASPAWQYDADEADARMVAEAEADGVMFGPYVWTGIRETDVLEVRGARENDDERHLCPLQLPVIKRSVNLWSNEGETVLSPFAGIGSEGVGALREGRRFVGVELKPAYFRVAARNLTAAAVAAASGDLFSAVVGA